ncbi:MAG: efflux RND transporter periplasmic adaptor subunit [Burkholderiales bacterium]|jgi:membrane fusion protein (multidrug efflux system)|nr:efflux RND transporter periplasmic adaptor subunit [Burkholderiales bacterium]
MESKRLVFILIPLVAALALGYLAYSYFRAPATPQAPAAGGGPGRGAGGPAPGDFAVAVEVGTVAVEPVTEEVTAVGTLRSNESVVVRPEVSGRIATIGFTEGGRVEKGAVLVALDASVQDAELQQAKASFALRERNLRRTEELLRDRFVSQSALDEATANLRVAESNVALAEAKLGKTRIRAPFPGVIGIRRVSVGDYVKEGQDLVTLEDISSLKVDFRVPEVFLTRLARGQTLAISTEAIPGRSFQATVEAIDPLIDEAGRAVLIRARLLNTEGMLRPGMFVRVRLVLTERPRALVVAEEAIVPIGADQFVFRVVGGKAERVKVATGVRRAGRVEIREGLAAGDTVVTAGQIKLRDGVSVRTGPSGAPPGAGAPKAGEARK